MRILGVVVAAVLSALVFAACGGGGSGRPLGRVDPGSAEALRSAANFFNVFVDDSDKDARLAADLRLDDCAR